jgi:hypothetical protein
VRQYESYTIEYSPRVHGSPQSPKAHCLELGLGSFLPHPLQFAVQYSSCDMLTAAATNPTSQTYSGNPRSNTDAAGPHDTAIRCTCPTPTVIISWLLLPGESDSSWKPFNALQQGRSVYMRQLIHEEWRRWPKMNEVALGYRSIFKVTLYRINASLNYNRLILVRDTVRVERRELLRYQSCLDKLKWLTDILVVQSLSQISGQPG